VGASFCAHGQTGPEAHPASFKISTASFMRVLRPHRSVDNPLPSSAEVDETVEL
jgi:hypothetical protein